MQDDKQAREWLREARRNIAKGVSPFVRCYTDWINTSLAPKDALRIFMMASAVKPNALEEEVALVLLRKLLQERMVEVLPHKRGRR